MGALACLTGLSGSVLRKRGVYRGGAIGSLSPRWMLIGPQSACSHVTHRLKTYHWLLIRLVSCMNYDPSYPTLKSSRIAGAPESFVITSLWEATYRPRGSAYTHARLDALRSITSVMAVHRGCIKRTRFLQLPVFMRESGSEQLPCQVMERAFKASFLVTVLSDQAGMEIKWSKTGQRGDGMNLFSCTGELNHCGDVEDKIGPSLHPKILTLNKLSKKKNQIINNSINLLTDWFIHSLIHWFIRSFLHPFSIHASPVQGCGSTEPTSKDKKTNTTYTKRQNLREISLKKHQRLHFF